jgi:hypothetical protein
MTGGTVGTAGQLLGAGAVPVPGAAVVLGGVANGDVGLLATSIGADAWLAM